METNSNKTFSSTIWRGVCRIGKRIFNVLCKCAADMIIISLGCILTFVACYLIYVAGCWVSYEYKKHFASCDPEECYYSDYIYDDIYFHNHNDGEGYIYNKKTGKKLLKQVEWIAEPGYEDSLVCFSNGKKRGYFSKYTGKVVIEPKYDHAWIFSEGLASVDDGGVIKFIDPTGKVVIDNVRAYKKNMDGMLFHNSYCIQGNDNAEEELYGMIDKTGKLVLPMEYNSISRSDCYEMWIAEKDDATTTVFNNEMKPVLTLEESISVTIDDGTIDVIMPDYTMRKYDLDGTLIHDFYVTYVSMLEYEKEDIVYIENSYDDEEYRDCANDYYHPKGTARLRSYTAGWGKEGLMTADGHIVTMPLYEDIDAIGYDLYLCESTNGDCVVLNGKGEPVK